MDVREKLVEICFHEFCMVAGDSPCGCDGCPYGKYGSDGGECYEEYKNDKLTKLEKAGVTVQEWISAKDRLPDENEYVMIWCGECQIARIEKGISEEQRKAMKRGELDDPCETGWTLSSGYFELKRSQSYRACDEQGNNRVPYCWYANGGPMKWFGQEVTHWAHLPQPPKGE